MYENLVSQMAVLNPRNWVHENPRFGENEVKSLCKTFHSSWFILVLLNTSQVVEELFLINSTCCLWQLTVYHQAMPTMSEGLAQ